MCIILPTRGYKIQFYRLFIPTWVKLYRRGYKYTDAGCVVRGHLGKMLKSVKNPKGGPLQIGPDLRVCFYRHRNQGTQKLYRHLFVYQLLPTSAFRAGETLACVNNMEMCVKTRFYRHCDSTREGSM